ncbi:hypothetical protein GCM10027176_06190 [Actinoallomurus bryophytorum]
MVALVVLAGCGNGGAARTSSAPSISIQPSATALPAFLRVTGRPNGSLVAVVWRNGVTTITSRLGGAKVTIAGKAGRYTKRGRLVAMAKTYHDGVKLKNARGHTLWRAKVAKKVVQIRQGETAVRYEFRHYADDRIVVRQGLVLIGTVRPIEQGAELVDARGVKVGLSSSPPGNDMAVLLCAEMPPDLRAVLTTAMLRHR